MEHLLVSKYLEPNILSATVICSDAIHMFSSNETNLNPNPLHHLTLRSPGVDSEIASRRLNLGIMSTSVAFLPVVEEA